MEEKINWLKTLEWEEEQLEDLRLAGYSYIRQGKYDIALSFFEALGVLNPEDAWVHFNLGEMYWRQGEVIRTIEEYKKAIELEPGIDWFHLALSEVYRAENEADLALEKSEESHRN